jgi:hypothetical protein
VYFGGSILKKISLIISALILSMSFLFVSNVMADNLPETSTETTQSSKDENTELDNPYGNASKVTISRLKTKEEKIAYYTEALGGNKTNGVVLYWLNVVKDYSVPVCFVLLVIAALNFFIIGNKKLDRREKGFSMLVTLIVGLIVFQVLPFLFAIIVAGR